MSEGTSSTKRKNTGDTQAIFARTKASVDIETQCAVELPQGGHCARSLACMRHSFAAKRAVAGRSAPFDQLLIEHQGQKKADSPAA